MIPPSSVLDAQISFPFSIPPPTGAFVLLRCFTAPLPRPSPGLWWQQMVCCVQPGGAEPRSPRSDGETKPEAAVPVPWGCTGPLCRSQEPRVCSGVGRGRIWLFTELMHPI